MAEEQAQQPVVLELRKLYLGNLSIEVPDAPEIFNTELNPQINLGISHQIATLKEEHFYGVRLRITVTAKNSDDKTIYLVEAEQGGVFEIRGLDDRYMHHALNVYCTTTLYPYARETITSAITRAGFPPIYLTAINFDAIYQQQLAQQQQQQQEQQESSAPVEGSDN